MIPLLDTPPRQAAIRQYLIAHYFNTSKRDWLESPEGRTHVDECTFVRYRQNCQYVLPWVLQAVSLSDSEVVDIGCGLGSSSVAFAQVSRRVVSYEIDANLVDITNHRIATLEVTNAQGVLIDGQQEELELTARHPGGFEAVLLNAVLEHMPPETRLDLLRFVWRHLRPGGVVIVAETPNLLTWTDQHTSQLPFFHQLPWQVAVEYVKHSKRQPLRDSIGNAPDKRTCRFHWGTGVSYHDFQIAFDADDLRTILIDDGTNAIISPLWNETPDSRQLLDYMKRKAPDIPAGFSREVLNLIFRKPGATQ